MSIVRALWGYRGFILGSVQREFQARYQNSLLGVAWLVANPLATIAVYTIVFSQLMRPRLEGVEGGFAYSIYLCAGVITWGYFTEIVGRAQNVFIDNANLIKKLSFPRLCLPVIVVLSAALNLGILLAIFLLFLVAVGQFPGGVLWALLPVLLVQTALSVGLGITLGVFNVFFRDVGQFFTIFLGFWYWLTPIVYPVGILPPVVAKWLALNPMVPVIESYHAIFVARLVPQWNSLLPVAGLALVLCVLGLWLFRRHAGDMVDEL